MFLGDWLKAPGHMAAGRSGPFAGKAAWERRFRGATAQREESSQLPLSFEVYGEAPCLLLKAVR